MKSFSQAFLLIALLNGALLFAQASQPETGGRHSTPIKEREQTSSALLQKPLHVHEHRPHADAMVVPQEEKASLAKPQRHGSPNSDRPTFPGALPSIGSAFGDAQQEWVQHYGSGLYPSYEAATAAAIDGAGNVYITGYGINTDRKFGTDYLTVKYSPAGIELWRAYYDGPDRGEDYAMAIAVDAAGNVYVTGYSYGASTAYDYATVKYNSSGVQQWAQRYNGPGNDEDAAYAIKVDSSGSVYVTGESFGVNSYSDWATIKYSGSGVQQWVQRHEGSSNLYDVARDLAVDGAGNVYATGYSYNSGTYYDCTTIKYNNAGVQQWAQNYHGLGNDYDYATAITLDASGNVYVAGNSYGATNRYDWAVLKYNNAGVQQWAQPYNGPGNSTDYATAIAVDAAGNVYVSGPSTGSGSSYDYATLKYNSAGVQQWAQRYNGLGNSGDYATGIGLDASGNVYVSGYSYAGFSTSYDYVTIKYNNAGAQQWLQSYNGPGNSGDYTSIDYPFHVNTFVVDAAGNAHLAGFSYGGSNTDYDCATVKYNSGGVKQWEARYNGPGSSLDFATAIASDTAGNVYVTGYSYALGTGYDYLTVKYSSTGVLQWQQRYNSSGSFSNYAYDLAVDLAGNVYVTGSHGTIKYNSAGVQLWFVSSSSVSSIAPPALAVDGSGNVFVINSFFRSGTGYDYRLVKYNSAGVLQWTVYYSGPGNNSDYATALAVDGAGNVYVTGYSHGGSTYYDYATIKYDNAGVAQWTQRYNHAAADSNDYAYAIALDASGNVYVTGASYSSSTSYDYATIKHNNAGALQWVQRATSLGLSADVASNVEVDAAGNIFVAGASGTVKYNPSGITLWIAGSPAEDLTLDQAGNAYVTASRYNGAKSGYDIFTTKYNGRTGVEEWIEIYGAPGNAVDTPGDYNRALAVDDKGNVHVAGYSDGINWTVFTTIKYSQTVAPPPPNACTGPAIFPARSGSATVSDPISARDGDTLFVDIRMQENPIPIDAFSFTAQVNAAHLKFIGAQPGSLTANFISVSAQENPSGSGTLTCGGFGATAIPANSSGVLLRLRFVMTCNPVDTSTITLSNPRDDLAGITTCGNLAVCDVCTNNGDINDDKSLTPGDALCAFQIFLNNGSVPGECDTPNFDCEVAAADVNCDNSVTPGDAQAIFQRFLAGQPPASCFAKSNFAKSSSTPPYRLTGKTHAVASANFGEAQMLKLVLRLENPRGLGAFGLSVSFPAAKLQFLGVKRGNITAEWTQLDARESRPGMITIGGFHSSPAQNSAAGEIFELLFTSTAQAIDVNDFIVADFTDDFSGALLTNLASAASATVPREFRLHQNHPNPFNPETVISYDLAQAVEVKLEIFDLLGRRVRTLVNQTQHAGRYTATWDGRNERGEQMATGVFIYRLQAGDFTQSRKMLMAQ